MKQKQMWLAQEFTKLIRVVLSLYVDEREGFLTYKKINIESDDIFEHF